MYDSVPVWDVAAEQAKGYNRVILLTLHAMAGIDDHAGRVAKQAPKAFYIAGQSLFRIGQMGFRLLEEPNISLFQSHACFNIERNEPQKLSKDVTKIRQTFSLFRRKTIQHTKQAPESLDALRQLHRGDCR